MQQSYKAFVQKVSKTNFKSVQQSFQRTKSKFLPEQKLTQPILHSQQIHNPIRKSPYLNDKLPYENQTNLYLSVVSYMKAYILNQEKQIKSFIQFLQSQKNNLSEAQINRIINRIDMLRVTYPEFQLIMYVIANGNKNTVKNYIKLRQQIFNKCKHDKTRNNPISIHNQNKHFKKDAPEIGDAYVNYEYWRYLSSLLYIQINQQIFLWISKGEKEISAVTFIILCLWAIEQSKKSQQSY